MPLNPKPDPGIEFDLLEKIKLRVVVLFALTQLNRRFAPIPHLRHHASRE